MGRIRYVPNRAGLREILASPEAAALTAEHGNRMAAAAGDGFVASTRMGKVRQRTIVFPDTFSAIGRNRRDNTLVRVLG